jgi:hypothetical protein
VFGIVKANYNGFCCGFSLFCERVILMIVHGDIHKLTINGFIVRHQTAQLAAIDLSPHHDQNRIREKLKSRENLHQLRF